MSRLILLSLVIIFSLGLEGEACEPCSKNYNLKESVQGADLIVVGVKVKDGPRSDFGEGYGGPDWIEVAVSHTFLGESPSEVIRINSWDAMCGYGVLISDNKAHVLILKESKSIEEGYQFDSVYSGCGIKALPIEGDLILWEEKKISFLQFREELIRLGARCFDIHGGNQCQFKHSLDEQKNIGTQNDFLEGYHCQKDADCYATNEGNCLTGVQIAEAFKDQIKSDQKQASCQCLKGPVIFGCVPAEN